MEDSENSQINDTLVNFSIFNQEYRAKPNKIQFKLVQKWARVFAKSGPLTIAIRDLLFEIRQEHKRFPFGEEFLTDVANYMFNDSSKKSERPKIFQIIYDGHKEYKEMKTKEERELLLAEYRDLLLNHKHFESKLEKRFLNFRRRTTPTNGKDFEHDLAHFMYP